MPVADCKAEVLPHRPTSHHPTFIIVFEGQVVGRVGTFIGDFAGEREIFSLADGGGEG